MSADLLEVVFNHDPAGATADALNVRQNAQTPGLLPEWRRGRGAGQQSFACYARDAIAGPLFVAARFARRHPSTPSVAQPYQV